MDNIYCSILLCGGLGNRLFQLATLYSTSKKFNKIPIISEISLNPHQTQSDEYFQREFLKNTNEINFTNVRKIDEKLSKCYTFCPFNEKKMEKNNIMLRGYFQSELYFLEDRNELLRFFLPSLEKFETLYEKLATSFTIDVIEMKSEMKKMAFLHVRRGDFVGHHFHSIDLTFYYECAINLYESDTIFLVCSDNIEWCKTNMTTIFKENKIRFIPIDFQENDTLWIMSKCERGGICANSTFSWWGAWLNTNEEKKVIFPSRLVNTDWNVTDYYPLKSIVLPVEK